jgi:protein ImuB
MAIDVSGLRRMFGDSRAIGDAIRRELAARGVRAHVAITSTRTAAMMLALARPGLTVVAPGDEAVALASIPVDFLQRIHVEPQSTPSPQRNNSDLQRSASSAISAVKRWGVRTLGELAALPAAELAARLGKPARAWQAMARGEDLGPLVPTLPEERFDASLDLEWPVEELEPLSFVLTRLLEPLSTRLERRDRGAAVLHVLLRLVTNACAERETVARRLELPSPMRDVRALRTLALLDLEAHPPGGAIDRVTVVIDPTPGRVLQHTLFMRAHPTPEQLSTLLARLGALMGQDRFGAPAALDSHRPGAFAMAPFKTDHARAGRPGRACGPGGKTTFPCSPYQPHLPHPTTGHQPLASALRRCRQPVPARVAVVDGRPVRVTTDRRGFAGGSVTHCVGPWRTSGEWWAGEPGRSGEAGREERFPHPPYPPHPSPWDRDEWDVALTDGAVYRIFQNRAAHGWFIDAIAD